jgi:hypothetical protein
MPVPPSEKPVATRKAQKPISFRPDEEVYQILELRAKELGVSIHELSCHYVTTAIYADSDEEASPESVVAMLVELREDLALGVESLLASAGKVSAEEARKWADKNLRQ